VQVEKSTGSASTYYFLITLGPVLVFVVLFAMFKVSHVLILARTACHPFWHARTCHFYRGPPIPEQNLECGPHVRDKKMEK